MPSPSGSVRAAGIDSVQDLAVFDRIVQTGSLSGAARELGLSLSYVSKRLGRLEARFGVRLVNRTTRALSLTEAGRDFHGRCLVILEAVRQAEDRLTSRSFEISGSLTVTSSIAFCRLFLAGVIARFRQRHPRALVRLAEDDGVVDIVGAGVDLAVRQAVLPDSSLIATAIASDHRLVCAAPDYLARAPALTHPRDLPAHDCVVFGTPPIKDWTLARGDDTLTVPVDWRIATRSGDAAAAAVIAGAGLAYASIWSAWPDIETGRLVDALPGWRSPTRSIYAVYPSRRHRTPLLKEFVEFLASEARIAQRRMAAGAAAGGPARGDRVPLSKAR